MDNELVEAVARRFHETYERLAPQFSYETRKASAVPWESVPENNRKLMIATVGEVLAATPLASLKAENEALRHRLLAVLGFYRDDMPAAAVKAFQELLVTDADRAALTNKERMDG